jgi:hypothetical protein
MRKKTGKREVAGRREYESKGTESDKRLQSHKDKRRRKY